MKTEIISFYSDVDGTTYYSDCADALKSRLTSLLVPHDIRQKESLGSYQKNCLSKPQFIYSMLEEKKKPLVWLDIDSTVFQAPYIFDAFHTDTDMAFACSNIDPENAVKSLKASPIYFNYNENVKEFLENWINIASQLEAKGKWFDHEPLLGLMQAYIKEPEYSFKFVGPEYCVWPGGENESTIILMGLSDAESKKSKLREMGFSEEAIAWQSPGLK